MKSFIANVVLVDVGHESVPRGKIRQQLHDQGCVADLLGFKGDLQEEDIFGLLEDTFGHVLDQSSPTPR